MAKLPRDLDGWVKLLRKGWPVRALPADVSRGLSALVRQYLRANSAGRERIRAAVTEPLADRLWLFARRAAEKAVRRTDPDFLARGLAAVAVGARRKDPGFLTAALAALAVGSRWIDPRDVLVAFSLISHSADKLRIDYRRLFAGARELAGKGFAELVQDWLERTAFERSIYEMGYKEANDSKRFRYVEHDDF